MHIIWKIFIQGCELRRNGIKGLFKNGDNDNAYIMITQNNNFSNVRWNAL